MPTLLSPRPFAAATAAALCILGCVIGDDGGSSSGSSGGSSGGGSSGSSGAAGQDASVTTTAGKACFDTATAFATAAKRCGGNFDAEYAAFVRDVAGGDCNSVSIRDEAQLRNQCFPSFARISCDALVNQRFDPSCAEQIIARR